MKPDATTERKLEVIGPRKSMNKHHALIRLEQNFGGSNISKGPRLTAHPLHILLFPTSLAAATKYGCDETKDSTP
jgi:hypothetical protein